MSLSSLLKKASSLLGLSSPDSNRPPPLDGEIIFCKNNVCVHPPAALTAEVEHYPGYLNIRSQEDEVLGSTLVLTWIPNSTLKKNPRSIENSPRQVKVSPRRSPRQEYSKQEDGGQADESDRRRDSIQSNEEEYSRKGEGLCESYKSQASDSGISQDLPVGEGVLKSTSRNTHDLPKVKGHGENGYCKKERLEEGEHDLCDVSPVDSAGSGGSGLSSESQSPSTEAQLRSLLSRNKIFNPTIKEHVLDDNRRRTSSNRSVTSIEMEGDNLIVVTEEVDESAFVDETEVETRSKSSPLNQVSEDCEPLGCNSVSSDSTCPSPGVDKYKCMEQQLSGDKPDIAQDKPDITQDKPDITQDKLDITQDKSDITQDKPDITQDKLQIIQDKPEIIQDKSDIIQDKSDNLLGTEREKSCTRQDNSSDTRQNSIDKLKGSLDLKLSLQNQPMSDCIITPDISVTDYNESTCTSSSSTPTSGPDSTPPSPITPPQYYTPGSTPSQHYFASSEESLAISHNMSFPANSVIYTSELAQSPSGTGHKSAKDQLCGVFSVDLGQMRSLRIFYTNDNCTSGQLVIASRESQYKILNFHHGGLDRLADTLSHWKFLAQPKQEKQFSLFSRQRSELSDTKCRQFSVIRPYLTGDQCHPEEGAYETINEETWKQHMNECGQIEDDFHLRRAIFFAGLEPSLRHEMWPFLLHYYPYNSTFEERERIRNDRYIIYQNLRKERESMSPEEQVKFWRSIQSIVEKDVVRTDRSHPYFKGEDNPNLEVLKSILLNYAVAHPCYGYTQGMSDLLAPVLVEVQNEVDAYWCFLGLMQRTIFVSSPKDVDMDKQLTYLRELLRLILPHFYEHLLKVQDGMELLFCHRWILLCFKREFPEADALAMWEACWAHYQTDYFHLFICVAIIAVYGEDVVQQDLPADEMLLHFSSLSLHMSGPVILRKARGLLHQFRILTKIPCTLEGICTLCSAGMWDSGHVPTVQCVGNHPDTDDLCPYGGKVTSPSP